MREIKFRAWDKETKELSYDFLSKNWLKVCIESPYVELMQYTGLTDRNGKEIYEGDVIRSESFPNRIGENYAIENLAEFHYLAIDLAMGPNDVEIIGNIYENPELEASA